jgi:hypothetical protein
VPRVGSLPAPPPDTLVLADGQLRPWCQTSQRGEDGSYRGCHDPRFCWHCHPYYNSGCVVPALAGKLRVRASLPILPGGRTTLMSQPELAFSLLTSTGRSRSPRRCHVHGVEQHSLLPRVGKAIRSVAALGADFVGSNIPIWLSRASWANFRGRLTRLPAQEYRHLRDNEQRVGG